MGHQRDEAMELRASTTPPTTSSSPAPPASRAAPRASVPFSCRPMRPGFQVEFFWWTFNMPTDHAEVSLERRASRRRRAVRRGRPRPGTGAALRPREPHPPGSVVTRRRAVLHRRGRRVRQQPDHVGQEAVGQPGHPVPPRRVAHRGGHAPPARPVHAPRCSTRNTTWRSPTSWRCATTAPTVSRAMPPTGPCRPAAAWATRGTCRSSTSTATIAATASPRAPRRSRCARSASTSSASAEN